MEGGRKDTDNSSVFWRPTNGLGGTTMLQWKVRATVLAVSLAAIASAAGSWGPILWGWGK
jgi:hypothetical protein